MKRTSTFWSLMFIGLGAGTCITQIIQVRPRQKLLCGCDTAEICIWRHSVGQRSSPWLFESVKVEIKFLLERKLHFPCAQYRFRQLINWYRGQVLNFLARFWRLTNVKNSHDNCLGFVILFSNRRLQWPHSGRSPSFSTTCLANLEKF